MARVVVIASSHLDRSELEGFVHADDDLVLLVPAVEQSRLQWLANDEEDARARAANVGATIERGAPSEVSTVEVKPDPPGQLVLDAIAAHDPDRVVLALREGDDATWLEKGELEAIPAEVGGIPVVRLSL